MGSETRPGGRFEHVCWVFRRHLCRMRVGLRNGLGLKYQKWGWVSECVGKGVHGWAFW